MKVAEYLGNLVLSQLEGKKPLDLPDGISMAELIDISGRNHMDYIVLGGLLKVDNITEADKQGLRAKVMGSVMCTMVQVTELKELERRFEAGQIKNQPMKGARMKFLYPSPEIREMSDIDVLVDNACMGDAANVLVDMGYKLQHSIKHHDIYVKPPYMVVEVHRALYDKTVDGGQYRYFTNFSKTFLREGYTCTYDFSTEDFYIYMLAHMAKHFYARGCGIRNLVDIYIYRQKFDSCMDRSYLKKELNECGILEFAEHMEKLADIWLNGGKSSCFYEDLFQYMQDSGIYGKDENGIWNKFAEKKMKNKEATVTRLKMWYYFPPVSYMSEYYTWLEDYPFCLPVAWAIRFFGGVFQKKGVHKREMLHEIDHDQISTYQSIYQKMGLHFKG
ncbi:MAG TPA: nucleotidyltransferase family protein [Lachnospiraceae bacterium]|nr:nucleotidyltransferase family protein [Lachnospiraceae bacterium]